MDQVVYGLGYQGEVLELGSKPASKIMSETASRGEHPGLCEQLKAWIVSDGENLGLGSMVGGLLHGRSEKEVRVAPKVSSSDDHVASMNRVVESEMTYPLVKRVPELCRVRKVFECSRVGSEPD